MSLLARFRILTKILSIVLLLSAVAGGIAYFGIQALSSLNTAADNMQSAAGRSLLAARMNQNALALNRAEFRAALDPRPENILEARKVVEEHLKVFGERMEEVAKTRDEKARGMMPAVREAFAEYQRSLTATFRTLDAVKDFQMSDQGQKVRDSAMASRAASEMLQGNVRAIADQLNLRVTNL